MDARLLPRTDADRLSVHRVADGVRLRVFQRDEREQEVATGCIGDVLVRRRAIREAVLRDLHIVALLLERDAVHVLALDGGRCIALIHLENQIAAFALGR